MDDKGGIKFNEPPKLVGGYQMGGPQGMRFNLLIKPAWWHRLWTRFFLGWEWIDRDE